MKTIKPLSNRIVVKRNAHVVSKGGILLPETAQEKPKSGQVIACGPGVYNESGKLIPLAVKVGDMVLFSPYAGNAVDLKTTDDAEYLVMSEDDVLAILNP
jgi:chaperonin GroES